MGKYTKLSLLLLISGSCLMASCAPTTYVHQQQQSFHDYKAIKHSKVENKTRNPYAAKKIKK